MKKDIFIMNMLNYLIILAFVIFDISKSFVIGFVIGLILLDVWNFIKEL
jgi:hypothetical protein